MGDDGLEQEVKLDAGVGFRIPDLNGVAIGVTARTDPEQNLQALYVDTADLRLLRSGLTLRHRSERGSSKSPGEWTLKLPEPASGPGLTRHELNWPGSWGPVPAEIAALVRAYRRTAALGPVARLVTHRRRTVLCGRMGEPLLEIDDDVVSVMDGRLLAARFREVEVEVVGPAPEPLLETVVARLGEAGALPGDGRSKLARAIGFRATEAPDVTPVELGRSAPIGEAVRAAIAHGYLRLVAHDLGVRLDDDPEDVHQARVATRRLRSDLRTFRAFLPQEWAAETRQELGWLADALGGARDADVLLERLRLEVESLEARDRRPAGALVAKLAGERDRAHQELLTLMDTDRYGELVDRLAAAARQLPPFKTSPAVDGLAAVGTEQPPAAADADGDGGTSVRFTAGEAVAGAPAATVGGLSAGAGAPSRAAGAPPGGPEAEVPGSRVDGDEETATSAPAAITGTPVSATTTGTPGSVGATGNPVSAATTETPTLVATAAPSRPGGNALALVLPTAHAVDASSSPKATAGGAEPDLDASARRLAPAVVAGPWKHLAQAVASLGSDPADAALHEVRIRAKRLRYACEAVAEVVGQPAAKLARAAADLQGVLGDFHDAIVAEEWLRAATVRASSAQSLAAGQLVARERDDAARCRAVWGDSWKRLHSKKLRAWVR